MATDVQQSPEACKQELLNQYEIWKLQRLVLENVPSSGVAVSISALAEKVHAHFLTIHGHEIDPNDPKVAPNTFRIDVLHAVSSIQRQSFSEYTLRFYEADDCVQFERKQQIS